MSVLDKLFRIDQRAFKKIKKKAVKVLDYEEEMKKLSDEELKAKTQYFKDQIQNNGKTVDDILPEAFAVCREAAKRVIGQFPYPVQVFGATVLNEGDVAEMKTGEGKTLTATMAVYLNALEGKGVHVVTVNEYLASRDAEWMGQIYRFLGLTVGVNLREKDTAGKQEAYKCDITYTTNSELGFDYLRDNMATRPQDRVLRGLHFAIVDEADSILIDESRTPLIISGGSGITANSYVTADRFVKSLRKDKDFTYDIKKKSCTLTDKGVDKVEAAFGIENLYDPQYSDLVHRIHQALKANFTMQKDVEYMVSNDEILLIDSFTGRVLQGREYSDGLQQAIQAKEHVTIKPETITLATITYQNFFRLYDKLSGMTGTAKTEEEEFRKIYNMRVIQIPTNRPVQRIDDVDLVFGNSNARFKALVEEVKKRHATGQPILIGTASVEKSEIVDKLLTEAGLPHDVLNAKNHAREAAIIAEAGKKGAITIATNMAGRGTDIKIDDEVKKLGGLAVLGTERHESRRIDNQLRGRSGRQGDPGYSRFFVSLDDELMQRFGSDNLQRLFGKMGDEPLESSMVTKAITTAQKRVEGNNFDARKQLLQYDDVMNTQREIMYGRRNEILDSESVHEQVLECMRNYVTDLVKSHTIDGILSEQDKKEIVSFANENLLDKDITENDISSLLDDDMIDFLYNKAKEEYEEKLNDVPVEITSEFEKALSLQVIDNYWMEQINVMSHLREGIYLRSYGQEDPLRAYSTEGFDLFDQMLQKIDHDVTIFLLKAEIQKTVERKPVTRNVQTNDDKSDSVKKPKKSKKVGRNDPCPCGSGKKYKNCCGK